MTMNDTEILENLNKALDQITNGGDLTMAVNLITKVRDHCQAKQEAAREYLQDNFYADARDHHLINQDLNRALGKK